MNLSLLRYNIPGERLVRSSIQPSIMLIFLLLRLCASRHCTFWDRHINNECESWEIKQSISRGINWLGSHPISDNTVLVDIFSKYAFGPYAPSGPISGNDYVCGQFDQTVKLLRERVPDYAPSAYGYDGLVTDILENWASIWRDRVVYEVLSAIVLYQGTV